MSNIFTSLIIAVLSLHFFTITYRLNGVNRALFNIPISIFETSIPLVTDDGVPEMYFDRNTLNSKLSSYFSASLKKYVNSYQVDYYYYNQYDDSICRGNMCDAIEITLNANVVLTVKYHKVARFYIQRN